MLCMCVQIRVLYMFVRKLSADLSTGGGQVVVVVVVAAADIYVQVVFH